MAHAFIPVGNPILSSEIVALQFAKLSQRTALKAGYGTGYAYI